MTAAHDQVISNRYIVHYPEHPARTSDPHYRDFDHFHRIHRATARCAFGEEIGDFSLCLDAQGNPAPPPLDGGEQPGLELHHSHVEFSLQNGVDLSLLSHVYPGIENPDEVGAWVESAANLVWYCAGHHRGAGGVHRASSSDFEAEHFVRDLISKTSAPREAFLLPTPRSRRPRRPPSLSRRVPHVKFIPGKSSPRCHPAIRDLVEYVNGPIDAPESVAPPAITDWHMDENDRLGCCGFAGQDHANMTWEWLTHQTVRPAGDSVVGQAYLSYNHGQDAGVVLAKVLRDWTARALIPGLWHILRYAPVHPQHIPALKYTISTFGGAYVGIQLPQSAEDQFNAGEEWTVVPGSPILGGHCVWLCGYDAEGVYLVSWGRCVKASWQWWQTYGDEAWAIIPHEYHASNPDGIDVAQLDSDLHLAAAG